ncbi:Phosphodiest-domain-containing protein, partial [Polychaeton citri CBS 116435]
YEPRTASNGTHTFLPTTILISLDGFRADFLHRNVTPNLSRFLQQGVSPKYMLPSFPSLTFPNHFTIATGLHPESHGIVGNNFFAPDLDRDFYYTDPGRSMQPEWWAAEPIWVRAEKAGIRTAIHMWPGSEAGIGDVELAWVDKYNGGEQLGSKVDRIMWWLDRPGPKGVRPQFIAAYVPDVDADGHRHGPNSTEVRDTITAADEMIGGIMQGIEERNLTGIVNVIVVSDHGMATTDKTRLFQLEDLVDVDSIAHMDTWPLFGLRFKDETEARLRKVYNEISSRLQHVKYKGKLDVYLREDLPERFHFSNNANGRIAPLWLIPKTGFAIVTKQEYDLALLDSDRHIGTNMNDDRSYAPRGLHGYDNQHPLMRAIFAARGPAFPHVPGSELEPFQNTEVYNMVCDSLSIPPRDNNGTFRLPLTPIGVHKFPLSLDLPDDPGLNHVADGDPASDEAEVEAGGGDDGDVEGVVEQGSQPERPEIKDGKEDHTKEVKIESWLDWVHNKIDNVKDWAKSSFGGHSEN